jgi:hypothetical protein
MEDGIPSSVAILQFLWFRSLYRPDDGSLSRVETLSPLILL